MALFQKNIDFSVEITETIQNFYRYRVAKYIPGEEDVVTIQDKNGKKKEQTQILIMRFNDVVFLRNSILTYLL